MAVESDSQNGPEHRAAVAVADVEPGERRRQAPTGEAGGEVLQRPLQPSAAGGIDEKTAGPAAARWVATWRRLYRAHPWGRQRCGGPRLFLAGHRHPVAGRVTRAHSPGRPSPGSGAGAGRRRTRLLKDTATGSPTCKGRSHRSAPTLKSGPPPSWRMVNRPPDRGGAVLQQRAGAGADQAADHGHGRPAPLAAVDGVAAARRQKPRPPPRQARSGCRSARSAWIRCRPSNSVNSTSSTTPRATSGHPARAAVAERGGAGLTHRF